MIARPDSFNSLLAAIAPDRARRSALIFSLVLVTVSVMSIGLARVQFPVSLAFVPIAGTAWASADLLTAFLLFSQVRVNGDRSQLVVAAAYVVTGLLTIPYILFFPLGGNIAPILDHSTQISIVVWAIWHLIFPVTIGVVYLRSRRGLPAPTVGGSPTRLPILKTVTIAVGVALTVAVTVVMVRASLPVIVDRTRFSPIYSLFITPAIILSNAAAFAVISARFRRPSMLQVWIGVALLSGMLDGILNFFSPGRYSLPWYAGKVQTIVAASVVLGVLLSEIARLYVEMGKLALVDSLTGLQNRRAFDAYCDRILAYSRRFDNDAAFLIADIDFFKGYNDRYGHAAGDECLRRVAEAIDLTVSRDGDTVARYGGEEFVALLPGTSLDGARDVAERIRRNVEAMQIPHAASSVAPYVTISIGVATLRACGRGTTLLSLYEAADRALYIAKETRNTTAIDPPAPVLSPVG